MNQRKVEHAHTFLKSFDITGNLGGWFIAQVKKLFVMFKMFRVEKEVKPVSEFHMQVDSPGFKDATCL